MTRKRTTTANGEPIKKVKLAKPTLRDLDAKSKAMDVRGGRRKGGDPEEGGE